MLKRKHRCIYITVFILIFVLTGVLHCFVRPAYDDFYYMTFTDNGIFGYLKNSADHYLNLTGRAFVHFLLCPLLAFNMLPFKIWNTFLITAFAVLAGLVCKRKEETAFCSASVSFSLFWLIGISTLSDGALWGAGSFNYLFPAFLIVLYYYLFSRSIEGKKNYFLCILAFLSAATVEMTGILSIFVVLYCSFVNKNEIKANKRFILANLISSILGYITLFLSGGISKRLAGNDYHSISLFDRTLSNFSLFCRRICSSEGLSAILIITFIICSIYMIKQKKSLWAFVGFLNVILLTLTSTNIIYHSYIICITAFFAFITLCAYAVIFYMQKERTIPFFMLCVFISLGICMVSPVMAYRMLLPSAVFLLVMCVKALNLCGFTHKTLISISCVLALFASASLIFYIQKFGANAEIIDKNISLAENYDKSGTLILESVPDEIYGNGTVPSLSDFGVHYLNHNGIFDAQINIKETNCRELYFKNEKLPFASISRNNVIYVPVRTAADVCDAQVTWYLACAQVKTEDKTFRFCSGAKAADTGLYLSPSVKLSHPVRIINGTTYISLQDFNAVFNVNLETAD